MSDVVESPCKWGGGNDYLACRVCRMEYDYRSQERPSCGAAIEIARLRAELAKVEGERDEATRLATEHVQARFHAEQREHNAHLAVKEERDLANAAEARALAAEARMGECVKALEPFAGCIFNDNGDITVNFRPFTPDELISAYFAHKRTRNRPHPEGQRPWLT